MLNIELVRFEAQDVITASVMRPHKPHHKPEQKPEPAPVCDCVKYGPCTIIEGLHTHPDANGNPMLCPGLDGDITKHSHN